MGKAISIQLAQQGFYVLINYRSAHEEAQKVKAEIEEAGGKAELLPFDVSDSQKVEEVLGGWMKENDKHIDVLVNNAGIT